MRGRIVDIAKGMDGMARVSLSLNPGAVDELLTLRECEVDVEVRKHRERRSLDANAYAWLLIGKIAEAIKPPLPKDDVYMMMLRRYGQSGTVCVLTKAVEDFRRAYKYTDVISQRGKGEDSVTYIRYYIGTSEYDTREMSLFIDGVVEEARQLGIDTDTPAQKLRWEGYDALHIRDTRHAGRADDKTTVRRAEAHVV